MRRISSLPTSEFCSKVDRVGQDVETTQAARGTVFHAYCAEGFWPASISQLPQHDIEEIKLWKRPKPFPYKIGDVTHELSYDNSIKEQRVALDYDFEWVEVDPALPQGKIAEAHPNVMLCGHLDMVWVIPDRDLVIVCDIKSSIFAVHDRCDSLQLHGYGMGACAKFKVGRYVTVIWDATDGKYFVRPEGAIEIDSFEAEDLRARMRTAASERDGNFRVGSHCGQCWKRSSCPAHLVNVPEGEFKTLLAGVATKVEVREAIVKLAQLKSLAKEVEGAIKSHVQQRGPVPSEDGRKEYAVMLRGGRPSTDYERVCRDLGVTDLEKYQTRGGDHEAYQWRNKSA